MRFQNELPKCIWRSGTGLLNTLQMTAAESKETVVESVEMGNGDSVGEEDEASEPVLEDGSAGSREFDPAKMGYNYVDFAGNMTLVS